MMKNCTRVWRTEQPLGDVYTGGLVVIRGDCPVWKFCQLFQRAICEGAGVVAIAHGDANISDYGAAIIAYSNAPYYTIGKTVKECDDYIYHELFPVQNEREYNELLPPH